MYCIACMSLSDRRYLTREDPLQHTIIASYHQGDWRREPGTDFFTPKEMEAASYFTLNEVSAEEAAMILFEAKR